MARGIWAVVAAVLVGAAVALILLTGPDAEEPMPPGDGRSSEDAPASAEIPAAEPDTNPRLEGAPGAEPVDAAPPTPDEGRTAGTLFEGKVLDAAGAPAGGAEVDILASAGVLASTVTDEDGAFAVRLVVAETLKTQTGLVRARGTDGSAGLLPLWFMVAKRPGALAGETGPAAPRQVGTVRLWPVHAFDVRVSSRCEAGLPATLWLASATSLVPWSVSQTNDAGEAALRGVPTGTWMLVAGAAGCGRARVLVKLPREETAPVELELLAAHVLTVRVQDAADGAPIAGATLHVREQLRLPNYYTYGPLLSVPYEHTTDAEGIIRIEGLSGSEVLTLSAAAEGYPKGSEHSRRGSGGPGQARVEPGQTEVVIELHQPLTVRWPIKNEGIGIPANGTEVVLEPWTNTGRLTVPPKGVIEGGAVVVDGWGPDGASGYAVIPDRGSARLSAGAGETTGYPTAFYPLRQVELTVRLPDGSPAEGWFLAVLDGGGNAVKLAVKTDTQGRAVMDGLYGGPGSLVNVRVSEGEGWNKFAMPLGSVDLHREDGHFEVDIPRERSFRIRLTIQGRAVPADFAGRATLYQSSIAPADDDGQSAEPGVFVARWRPVKQDQKVYVSAQARGYLAETKTLSVAELTDTTEVVIDLRPAGAVQIKVTEPADKRCAVTVQRWNEEAERWGASHLPLGYSPSSGRRADANGIVAYANLEPGRYRAVETQSGLTSDAFDVPAGGEPIEVAFDVSTTGWVRGRVVLPEGFSYEGVHVGAVDAAVEDYERWRAGAAALPGRAVNRKDGSFWIRVPGNRPLTIRLFHAMLRPHPTRGQITVTTPREDLELHAVRATSATLRFATPAPVRINPGRARPISVHLYEGAVAGVGLSLSGVLDEKHQTVEFGGYEPGTYTVWIDAPGHPPVVLRDVELGTDDTDLGTVDFEEGATLEVHVTVKEGQSPPRFSVWVQKLDEPTYTRRTDAAGETIKVTGIGPGRFRVSATAYNGAAPGLNEEVEFDGERTIVRTIDAR